MSDDINAFDDLSMDEMKARLNELESARTGGVSNLGSTRGDDKRRVMKVHKADIVHHDGEIMIPNGMAFKTAIALLKKRLAHLEQKCSVVREFDCFPWDGAAALARVLQNKYGWVPAKAIQGFFGSTPPTTISVETGYNETTQVPWGMFEIPGIEGNIQTSTGTGEGGKSIFVLQSDILRLHEDEINELYNDVEEELATNSIYRGKAVRIRFRDDDGDRMSLAEIKFMPTNVQEEDLIFSNDLMNTISTNLFTPIKRILDCIANGIPIKRGVLLGGPFGVGKTLAAAVAARLAVDNDITYVYVPRADELKEALAFARQYQSPACVVFCEDVDRVMSGDRSTSMDDILNIVDGIDGKNSNIIVVLTTNFLTNINPAMLRPGRLDAVINVTAPDAEASERLLRLYGAGAIEADEDLKEAGETLAGAIPAVHAEVTKRAKLSQLKLSEPGTVITNITGAALLEAAKTMTDQLDLLKPKETEAAPQMDSAVRRIVDESVSKGLEQGQRSIAKEAAKETLKAVNNQ